MRLDAARNIAQGLAAAARRRRAARRARLGARRGPRRVHLRLLRPARRARRVLRTPTGSLLGMLGARPARARRGSRSRGDGRAACRGSSGSRRRSSTSSPTASRARSRPAGARAARRSPSRTACSPRLSPAELEGVLAHELAHIRNRDVLVQTTAVIVAATLIELSPDRRLARRALLFVLGPIAAAFVHLLLSPKRELAADRAAAALLATPARARRRARATRAGERARRVPRQPRDGAALHAQPVRRGGPGAACSSRTRRSASGSQRLREPRPRLAREAARPPRTTKGPLSRPSSRE